MTIELFPAGRLSIWAENTVAGPGPMHARSSTAFKRVLWKGDGFDLESVNGMGGYRNGPDVAQVDVRVAFRDPDGTAVFLDYLVRAALPTHRTGHSPAFMTGRVDADDSVAKYAWLNRTQVVGKAYFDSVEGVQSYEMYALK